MNDYLIVKDMTNLFTKEIMLYSLFDLRFKKPVRFMLLVYILLLGLIWSVPAGFILIKIFGFNVWSATVILGPTIVLANLMSKPIWNNKSFFSWFSCQIKFLFSPKKFYDNRAINPGGKLKFDNQFTVSRSRDFRKLYLIQRELHEKY